MSTTNLWSPVGDIPVELDVRGAYRYQWLRNMEGGQNFGSRTVILALYDAIYEQHVLPKLSRDYRQQLPTLKLFLVRWPGDTHAEFFSGEGRWEWKFVRVGSPDQLRPRDRRFLFAEEVQDFNSDDAIDWGSKADSDLYPPAVVPEFWQ